MTADVPRRLGRGLEALISTAKLQRDAQPASQDASSPADSELRRIRIADITPNRFQPRRTFTEAELSELEGSIRTNGLLQPIAVRAKAAGGWELVAGERRLRAASRLGWTDIPAVIREFDDRAMLTLALVENLQRTDLNPLEEAQGYQRLIDEFGMTQLQVADAVGKDRTTITNLLRVLGLPSAIRNMVERGLLTAGHARALLPVKDARRQLELANEIVARHLSVREAEVRGRVDQEPSVRRQSAHAGKGGSHDPSARRVEEQLRKHLQTDVHIQQVGKDRGVVRIAYYGADDLERLLDLILGHSRSDFD